MMPRRVRFEIAVAQAGCSLPDEDGFELEPGCSLPTTINGLKSLPDILAQHRVRFPAALTSQAETALRSGALVWTSDDERVRVRRVH